ncbi:MAG: class I SAM-dependent methyltransferase, partial [Candidatus Zixiibacteriota bacterium]
KDNIFEKALLYLIRKKGKLRIERDLHVCGLFELETWRELLVKAGFQFHEKKGGVTHTDLPVFSCIKSL